MKPFNCTQGSLEWLELHRGVPTASNFDRILTPVKREIGKGAESYIYELIASVVDPAFVHRESYVSAAMKNGMQMEPEARAYYEFENNVKVDQIGFCTTDDGRFGGSPDGLVGDLGGIEIKYPETSTHIRYLIEDVVPSEYLMQVHGYLIVTGRKWWDFISRCPGLKTLVKRVTPDATTLQLEKALDVFWKKYQDVFARVREIDPDLQPKALADAQAEEDAAIAMF